jgi:hypothetical protein
MKESAVHDRLSGRQQVGSGPYWSALFHEDRRLTRWRGKPGDPGHLPRPGEDLDMARANSKVRDEESQRQSADRITVALIPKAAEDLHRLQGATGLSKTDIVNRAISLYEFVQSQVDDDSDFIVRDRKSGETQVVRFL